MDFEFDKEIDVLLRQSARGETVFAATNPKSLHLDADEISAFAENALPEKAKRRSMLHLADCDACRKTLSNLILPSADVGSETVHAAEKQAEKQTIAPPIPWHRRLFAFPNLAYTMGALVVVFSGIVGYTVLQNVSNSRSAEVSQISEKQPSGKAMSSDGDRAAVESFSNSMMSANTMMSNSASMNSSSNTSAIFSNPVMSSAPMRAMNSNAAMTRESSDKILRTESKSPAEQNEATDLVKNQDSSTVGAPPSPAKENAHQSDGAAQKQQNETQSSTARNQIDNLPLNGRRVENLPLTTMEAEKKTRKVEDLRDDTKLKSPEAGTNVGGKTFKRTDNVWYDSAYRGQPTTNVARGTREFKELDSGLRGIAENLGGTVVIVWKQKAYRIQ